MAALAPPLAEAMRTTRTKAFVTLDDTLLPIDHTSADTPYSHGRTDISHSRIIVIRHGLYWLDEAERAGARLN